MFELTVISGKGGTGKTSVAAALAALAQPVVLADADVDAPDFHLLASPQVQQTFEFVGGKRARVLTDRCCGCGRCAATCRFGALGEASGNGVVAMTYQVDPMACEGCGACVGACPAEAIVFEPVVNGERYISTTRFGPMSHARLYPGEENSGKLVGEVRREAQALAAQHDISLIITDGSPGIGCPVIASLTRTDHALIVAEPSLSGMHDALRVAGLARQMKVPVSLCINRCDVCPQATAQLEAAAVQEDLPLLAHIREDRAVVEAQQQAVSVIEYQLTPAAHDLRRLYAALTEVCGLAAGDAHEDCRTG
jgi:MinD superfamily P-loop ATPase